MIDPFVLLAPILLLPVIALLRFVGCDVVFHLDPIQPVPPVNFNVVGTPNSVSGGTNPFSAQAGQLLLAFVAAGQDVVTGVSAPGLPFAFVVKETGGGGSAEIWQAVASNDLTNVIATASTSAPSSVFVCVVSFSTTAGTTPVVGNTPDHMSGADGQPLATLAASSVNSLVFGVGNDFDNATTPQEGASQTIVQLITDMPNKNTFWVQRRTDTPLANVQTDIDDTLLAGDHWNLCVCEIHD